MNKADKQPLEEILAELEHLARLKQDNFKRPANLRFTFSPNSIGPYGIEESQWQADFVSGDSAITDYGRTVAESAQRLLDRLQHPENYPEPDDD